MPVRSGRPEDEQPLIRAVNQQVLVRPVGEEQSGQEETPGAGEAQEAPQAGGSSQAERGPIARAMDRAQENNWVYTSVAEKARESGLLDRADGVLSRVRSQLTGK